MISPCIYLFPVNFKMKKTLIITLFVFLSLLIITPASSTTVKKIPVPFTVQAPDANWGQPWQDTCEETVIAMVDFFYTGNSFTKDTAKKAILNIINIKEKYIGKSIDENAETIIYLINNFLPWEAYTVKNPTLIDIKSEIDNNRPVILPVHGKYLYNPYFKNGGPDYHTIVISGYDDAKQEFIVQEPGTKYGLDFHYSYDTILSAMHDYLPDLQTKFGKPVAIFTRPGSKLTGVLIKAPDDAKVYLLNNGIKRHIANEDVFLSYGWKWHEIFPVSGDFIKSLQTGKQIINSSF